MTAVHRRRVKNTIAVLLAISGVSILAAEAYRYAGSPLGIAEPSPWPWYLRTMKSEFCWFQMYYLPDQAGIRICQPYNPVKEGPQVLLGVDKAKFTVQIWKRPVGLSIGLPPLVYPFLLLPYPLLVLARLVRSRRSSSRFPGPACQECGYNLTGNKSGTCPECGSASL